MRRKQLLQYFLVAVLVVGMFGSIAPAQGIQAIKAQPALVELAAQNPTQKVQVIVQKAAGVSEVEEQVTSLGGQVTRDLHIINAFAAEMTAKAALELARAESVRWVSLDAPTRSSALATFTTWAVTNGTVTTNGFTDNAFMFDSALGPNGTYGYGDITKGAFSGFVAEITPGNAITKVELVVFGYTTTVLDSGADPKVTVYVAGMAGRRETLNHQAFDTYVGQANAGWVFLDITKSRTWKWSDFDNNLQVLIDQSGRFPKNKTIYYDAIGLRVTSDTGMDVASDTSSDSTPLATLDSSKQVNYYNQIIHSSELWNSTGKLQGKGVTVAVVDSGIYKTKDLNKRVRANLNFSTAYHDAADRYGHGTFVAGVVGGNGSASGNKYMGVAPRADLLNVRVNDDQGMAYESDVVNALQWVYENKARYNIRVVNLSLNSSVAQSYHTSPLAAACEILWFNSTVVVVSAGNSGSGVIYPPANDPFVITVGATDDKGTLSTTDDVVTSFSAYGTTPEGFAKPDLVAPGRNIIGLLPENNKLKIGKDHPSNRLDNTYFKLSGTSVSAPMVSGAVALLLQDEPNLNPDQVKYRLMATANRSWPGYDATTAGAGYLDIYAAVYGTTTETANTGTLPSQLLTTGQDPITWGSAGWNSAGWNSAGWNTAGWNTAGWNTAGWNSAGWNTDYWDQ